MAFDEETILAVWAKGKTLGDNNPAVWRQDECRAWMQFSKYGDRNSPYGWEIDHITPLDCGGSDALSNLRPLQWQNNASKEAGRFKCAVTAKGKDNRPA
jgi:5-methylcytosine-specific restriction endonuclease McrA